MLDPEKRQIGGVSDFVTVQSKIDSSDNRVDYVLAGEVLLEI